MITGLAAWDMLVHYIVERYAAAKWIIRDIWPLSGPYERATMMCGKWLSGEEKTLRIQNNFPIFVVQSDFRIRDTNRLISRRVYRIAGKEVHGDVGKCTSCGIFYGL